MISNDARAVTHTLEVVQASKEKKEMMSMDEIRDKVTVHCPIATEYLNCRYGG